MTTFRYGKKRGWYIHDPDADCTVFASRWLWFAKGVHKTYKRVSPNSTLVFLGPAGTLPVVYFSPEVIAVLKKNMGIK